jgi:hypothetical protein
MKSNSPNWGMGSFISNFFFVVVVKLEKTIFDEEALRVVKNYCHVMRPME